MHTLQSSSWASMMLGRSLLNFDCLTVHDAMCLLDYCSLWICSWYHIVCDFDPCLDLCLCLDFVSGLSLIFSLPNWFTFLPALWIMTLPHALCFCANLSYYTAIAFYSLFPDTMQWKCIYSTLNLSIRGWIYFAICLYIDCLQIIYKRCWNLTNIHF